MDIRQLRYFIAIVEEKKISAAAKRLHMSQPPLSQQLKSIEEELGTQLVERSGKNFVVTEAGNTLYKKALEITELMDESLIEVSEVGEGLNGRLTIGVNTFSTPNLANALQLFHDQFPNITYKIQQNESSHICQLVQNRVIEMAIIRLPLSLDGFQVKHLCNESFYFVTANSNEYTNKKISISEISEFPLLLPSTEGLGVHYLIFEAFSRAKVTPNIIGECSDIHLLMQLVSKDFAATIVPEVLIERLEHYDLRASRITPHSDLEGSVGIVWLKDHTLSTAAQNFLNILENI